METLSSGNNKILATYEQKRFKKKLTLPLFMEMPRKAIQQEKTKTFKYVFNKIRLKKCASATISKPLPTYNVAYLGNVVTGWAKGEGCIEKPLATLWRNYIQSSRPDVNMHLTVSGGGLKAITKNHGLTEYWAHRLTTCAAPHEFPRIFCWVYRHEGRRLRHELRCHAALCSSSEVASQIEKELKEFLVQALTDFKKDKLSRQNARLSLANSVQDNPSLPRRKILLATGCHNYRPPLECSKSAPKLSSIEEIFEEDDVDIFNNSEQVYKDILKSYERANVLFEQSKKLSRRKFNNKWNTIRNTATCYRNGVTGIQKNNDLVCNEGLEPNIIRQEQKNETEKEKCDKSDKILDLTQNNSPIEENNKEKPPYVEKKVDLDFKIGGEVLPAIKTLDKLPNIEHTFVSPIINKALLGQEQVSLIPVGETASDFSSLKVYKKRSFAENSKDFSACAMFFSAENISQLENIFQAHCSFSGDRSDEDISNKKNSSVLV